jgi:hypothetical protein
MSDPDYIVPEIDAGPDDLHGPSEDWPLPWPVGMEKPPPFTPPDDEGLADPDE